jgi:hypothetical protein
MRDEWWARTENNGFPLLQCEKSPFQGLGFQRPDCHEG